MYVLLLLVYKYVLLLLVYICIIVFSAYVCIIVISVHVCIIRTVSVCPSVRPCGGVRIVGVVEWEIHVRRQWRGHGVICLPLEVIGQSAILCR